MVTSAPPSSAYIATAPYTPTTCAPRPAAAGPPRGAPRDGARRAAVVGVHRHRAVQADDLRVDGGVARRGHLDDDVDPLRCDLADLGDDVLLAVVDDVRGARRGRRLRRAGAGEPRHPPSRRRA